MKRGLLVFSMLFFNTFDVSAQKLLISSEKRPSDVYQIYKAVLKELFIKPQTKQLVIRNLTSGNHPSISKALEKQNLQGNWLVQSEIVNNYQDMNKKQSELKDKFDLEVPVVLLNGMEVEATLNKIKEDYPKDKVAGKFREFLEQIYKGGFAVTLSNIGFNKGKNQALLHVEYGCGGLRSCGSGEYIFLMKESNGWIIKKQMLSWTS